MLPWDNHVHTKLCKHADGEAHAYAAAAVERGLRGLTFADHAPSPDDSYDPGNRMCMHEFADYATTVAQLRQEYPDRVRFGIEADYYEGCEQFLRDWLPAQGFDVVLGSVHYIGDWAFDNPAARKGWDRIKRIDAWSRYFDLVARMARTRMYDVAAHLDLPKKFEHRIPDADIRRLAAPALDEIAAAGMSIEVNTGGLRRPVREIYPSTMLLELARERDIPVCFGSDAHTAADVGADFGKALDCVRGIGYTETACYEKRERQMVALPAGC
jgi:histidinol-phosphatase (PHP family)